MRLKTMCVARGTLGLVCAALTLIALTLTGCVGLVGVPALPAVSSFSATPTTILSGQSAALAWASTNANFASLDNGIGQVSPNGGVTVSPTQTTVYTLTVKGPGGSATSQLTVTVNSAATVTITANPTTIFVGQSTVLTATATNATKVVITNNVDSTTYTLPAAGGTQSVSPAATTTYTATATDAKGKTATATATVTVNPAPTFQGSVNHILFLMQENHTFDNYFGMLNPYRASNGFRVGDDGKNYDVDGIDDKLSKISNMDDAGNSYSLFKLKSTCIDDDSSSWIASFGDVNRFDFAPNRPILMDGFVHTAEGYAKFCAIPANGCTGGQFADLIGRRAMGYYDQDYLNYYYYMASQFALSDRWFSPVASESIPNRIATLSGGTTQGLVYNPGSDDHLQQLNIKTIFEELDPAGISWKIYYSSTNDNCLYGSTNCPTPGSKYPSTTFSFFTYSFQFLHANPSHAACAAPTLNSGPAVGDPNNDFCIDTNRIAPITQYYSDLQNGTLPSFAYIEPGYSNNDEHPGSGQPILNGQAAVANVLDKFIASPSYKDSIFFLSYDEGGGPYDHVPPVPAHTNDFTDASLGITTDISSIAVNADSDFPCNLVVGSYHCDLRSGDPGTHPGDAPVTQGFAAQLGFRLPNMVISPFTRKHYVSHIPMDHTAVIRLVETRFLGTSAHLTARDNTQPSLMDFFDFTNVPWATPPTPPAPVTSGTCDAANMGP